MSSDGPCHLMVDARPIDWQLLTDFGSCSDCRCLEVDMGGTTLRHANSPSMAGDRLLPGQRPAVWLVPPLPDEPAPTVEDQTPTIAQRATVASAPLVDLPPLGSVERAGAVGPELGRVPRVASGPYDGRPRVARAPVRLTRRGRVVVLVLLTFLVAG